MINPLNQSITGIAEIFGPQIAKSVETLIGLGIGIGVMILVYLLFLIVKAFLQIRSAKDTRGILENVREINKKLDVIVKSKLKKK